MPTSPSQKFNQGFRPATARPRMVGPCYRCGKLAHLVANCLKPKQQYPFEQSLVKGTDIGLHCVLLRECVDIVKGIKVESAAWAALSPEHVDKVMLRELESANCLKELMPADGVGKPDDNYMGRLRMISL